MQTCTEQRSNHVIPGSTVSSICGWESEYREGWLVVTLGFLKKILFIYLLIFREREREGERGREKHQYERESLNNLVKCPNWGPNLQPRHVPWLGIGLATFCFVGWRPTHWATRIRPALGFWTAWASEPLTPPCSRLHCPVYFSRINYFIELFYFIILFYYIPKSKGTAW